MGNFITKILKGLWKGFKIIIAIFLAIVAVSAFLQISMLGIIALLLVVEKIGFLFFIPLLIIYVFLWGLLLRLLAMFFAVMAKFIGDI
ncbi:MAG: hypothetical protein WC788_08470 [Candidatus Paceibacterota bacterium]|jgi:hypothetical protein